MFLTLLWLVDFFTTQDDWASETAQKGLLAVILIEASSSICVCNFLRCGVKPFTVVLQGWFNASDVKVLE